MPIYALKYAIISHQTNDFEEASMTGQMSKADRIRKVWSDAMDGIQVISLRDAARKPWSVIRVPSHGKHLIFGVSCQNGTSISSIDMELDADRSLSPDDLSMNAKRGELRSLCDMLNGEGASGRFVASVFEEMPFLSDVEKKLLKPRLMNAWKKKLASVLENGGVNLEALTIVSRDIIVQPTSQSYAYYLPTAADPEIVERRKEAAGHYPFLTNLMATRIHVREVIDQMQPLAPALQGVIPQNSDGNPLIPAWMARRLTNANMVPPTAETLHLLSKLPPDKFPATDEEMIAANDISHNLMPLFGDNPQAILGKSFNGQWNAYRNSLILAFADTRPPEGIPEKSWEYIQSAIDFKAIQALSRDSKFEEVNHIAELIAKNIPLPPGTTGQMISSYIRRRYAPDVGPYALSVIKDTGDIMVNLMRNRMILPMAMNMADLIHPVLSGDVLKENNDIAIQLLTEGRTALNVIRQFRGMSNAMNALVNAGRPLTNDSVNQKMEEASQQAGFHTMTETDIALMQRAGAWSIGKSEWASLTGPFISDNKYVIVPLVSSADVSREAEAMDHCIGEYHIATAMNLEAFHYSVRRVEKGWPEHIVTFTFEPSTAQGLEMTMINGLHNSKIIPESAKAAIREFIQTRIDPIKMRMRQAIKEVKEQVKVEEINTGLPDGYHICNYDWRNISMLEKAFEVFGPAMPKKIGASLDSFVASRAMITAAKTIDPAGRSNVMKALTASHREGLFNQVKKKPSQPSFSP